MLTSTPSAGSPRDERAQLGAEAVVVAYIHSISVRHRPVDEATQKTADPGRDA
jgi:hypothetical protein